jgi:pilus assembly protein CpaF
MFQLTINEKGGQATAQSFEKNEITIGRVAGNDVVLPKGNISKRHSRIVLKDGKFIIVDLKSTNGTYVNGKKITAPQVIKATDKIYIGDYTLQLANGAGAVQAAAAPEAREPSARAKTGAARDEIDLFGGDASPDDEEPAAAPSKGGGSPGLIDDNFDQEFDVAADPPAKAKGPVPAKGGRLPPVKPVEPEPELDEPASDGELDLQSDFPMDDNAAAGDDDAGEEDMEEPELPKAPVVPMKPPKKGSSSAPSPRVQPSKAKASLPPPAATRGKAAPIEDVEEDEQPSEEMQLPEEPIIPAPPLAAATQRPTPAQPGLASLPKEMPTTAPQLSAAPSLPPSAPTPHLMQAVGHLQHAPQIVHAAPSGASMDRREAIHMLHLRVVEELGLRGYDLLALGSMRDRVTNTARSHVQRLQASGRLDVTEDADGIAKAVASLAIDMDLISALYGDDEVVQIAITHDRQVWVEREALRPDGGIISSEDQVIDLIRRLGVLGGADPSAKNPLVDVRLRDGARVVAVLPPLAFRGPTLSIRKAMRDAYLLDSFIEHGTISEGMAKFIDFCLRTKKNVLLSVGPGVNASATLNALASGIADDERVVTIESGVELHFHNLKNVTALEPSKELRVGALVKHAASMQPDHVIIGHMSGPDTADVLNALAGPLDGSIASYSASSAKEALERLASIELSALFKDSPSAARRMVAAAFPIILQEHRFPEGASRRITAISEVLIEGDDVVVQDIFVFQPEGIDESGVLNGSFVPTGHQPRFVQELVDRGDEIDLEIFKE